ncbi:MAG TPA: hypothetical protein VLX92_04215 [Kofleriaceae bacterium]|nr:hypothetical protein [Kofleriaceae bacterium]
MRTTVLVLALVCAGSRARADSFAELAGGLAIPVGDSDWTNDVDLSPKFAARVGASSGLFGGLLSVDWTPEQLSSSFDNALGGASGFRFRILAHLLVQHRVLPKLTIEGRFGGGIDLAHASYDYTLLGVHASGSNTDVGYAFELGGDVWYDVTPSVQIGGQIALPIGHHDDHASNGNISFVYTSYDLDLLFAARFVSR